MSNTKKTYQARSPADFPEPHHFGMWFGYGNALTSFRIYPDLKQIKSAISTGHTNYNGIVGSDIKIYEHDGVRWQEIYSLNKGDNKLEHELWKKGAAPKTLAVSDEAVDAAIQSILKAGESDGHQEG